VSFVGRGEEEEWVDWERAGVEKDVVDRRAVSAHCFHAMIVFFVERNGSSMGWSRSDATLCYLLFDGARPQTFGPILATAKPH